MILQTRLPNFFPLIRNLFVMQGQCLPLSKQIDYFEETIRQLKRQYSLLQLTSKKYLAESIFVTSIGSNDYFNNYLQPDFYNTSTLTPEQFSQLLVDSFSQKLEVNKRPLDCNQCNRLTIMTSNGVGIY